MSALLNHIQDQQDAATRLEALIGAVEACAWEPDFADLMIEILRRAKTVARNLQLALDSVSLPVDGKEAKARCEQASTASNA